MTPAELQARLAAHTIVTPDGCWLWTGRCDRDGYGTITHAGHTVAVHRLAFAAFTGQQPPVVMHRCDHRPCWNPAHLADGDHRANRADCVAKGRHARAERHGHAKLTWPAVDAIRTAAATHDATSTQLAARFGVCARNIRLIVTHATWR